MSCSEPAAATVPRITFAIPFYGSADYLERVLASVQRQTCPDWCVLVVDDCSPQPGAAEVVQALGDARIRYLRNEHNLGLAGNWNRCVQLASTPLVTLLHGDDELMPDYTALMLETHEHYPQVAAVFCDAEVIDSQGRTQYSFRDHVKRWLMPRREAAFMVAGEAGFASLLRGNFIMCPTLCYKRRLFERLSFSADWRMVLDLDFYLRALLAGESLMGLRQRAYRYRRHAEQVTVECERNLRLFTEEARLWRVSERAALARGWTQAARVAARMRFVQLHLCYYAGLDLLRGQWRAMGRKLALLARLRRADEPG
jgi:glycosyltransferase involved in cell wall biosynthesis